MPSPRQRLLSWKVRLARWPSTLLHCPASAPLRHNGAVEEPPSRPRRRWCATYAAPRASTTRPRTRSASSSKACAARKASQPHAAAKPFASGARADRHAQSRGPNDTQDRAGTRDWRTPLRTPPALWPKAGSCPKSAEGRRFAEELVAAGRFETVSDVRRRSAATATAPGDAARRAGGVGSVPRGMRRPRRLVGIRPGGGQARP